LAVAIRLKRFGRKKRPFYRVVVADTKDPRQGKAVDDLGYYDPLTKPAQIQINEERAIMWLKDGAKPSETVKSLLSKTGILQKFHDQKKSVDVTQETEQSDSEREVES